MNRVLSVFTLLSALVLSGCGYNTFQTTDEQVNAAWAEVLNSDATVYGGSGQGNMGSVQVADGAAHIVLPPLATIMLQFTG